MRQRMGAGQSRGSESLLYLYGIVPATVREPSGELLGLESAPIEVIRFDDLAAIVSRLPAAAYEEGRLNRSLADLAWVGERGVAHERVVQYFAERGPIVPLTLFSLHDSERSLEGKLRAEASALRQLLERLRGHQEWGVRLWRTELDESAIDRLSPALQALTAEIETASAGKRFLLEKKRSAMRAEEGRALSGRLAHELFVLLSADASESVPLTPGHAGDEGRERLLLLDGAFLLSEAAFPDFQAALTRFAAELAGTGFEVEFTGPWPPYHFTRGRGND